MSASHGKKLCPVQAEGVAHYLPLSCARRRNIVARRRLIRNSGQEALRHRQAAIGSLRMAQRGRAVSIVGIGVVIGRKEIIWRAHQGSHMVASDIRE